MFCRCRDDPAAANAAISLRTLRWTFPAKRASVVVTDSEPGRLAPLPRQRRGVWVVGAMCAGTIERSLWHVQAQARANHQGAGFIQSAAGGRQRRAHQAGEFEAGAGSGTAAPAERRHHCNDHDLHRLAAALGAGVFCAVVRKKLALRLESEKTDGELNASPSQAWRKNCNPFVASTFGFLYCCSNRW